MSSRESVADCGNERNMDGWRRNTMVAFPRNNRGNTTTVPESRSATIRAQRNPATRLDNSGNATQQLGPAWPGNTQPCNPAYIIYVILHEYNTILY